MRRRFLLFAWAFALTGPEAAPAHRELGCCIRQ